VDNIKLDLVDVGFGGVDWIGLAQDRYSLLIYFHRAIQNVVCRIVTVNG
jgi:hypothetical protein